MTDEEKLLCRLDKSFAEEERKLKRSLRIAISIYVGYVLIAACLFGTATYVAIHFIKKFW